MKSFQKIELMSHRCLFLRERKHRESVGYLIRADAIKVAKLGSVVTSGCSTGRTKHVFEVEVLDQVDRAILRIR